MLGAAVPQGHYPQSERGRGGDPLHGSRVGTGVGRGQRGHPLVRPPFHSHLLLANTSGRALLRDTEDTSPVPATPQPHHQQRCHQDQDCSPSEVCCHQQCSRECHAHGQGEGGTSPPAAWGSLVLSCLPPQSRAGWEPRTDGGDGCVLVPIGIPGPVCLAGTPTAVPAWQEGTRCWSNRDCGGGETCCGGQCAGLCNAEHQGGTRRAVEPGEPWGQAQLLSAAPMPLSRGVCCQSHGPRRRRCHSCGTRCAWGCGAKGDCGAKGLHDPWGRLGCDAGPHSHPGGTTATQRRVRQGKPASARPAPGCSPAMTAEPGAGAMLSAPGRRSAACVAVTTSVCLRPEVHTAQPHTGQGREAVGRGPPPALGAVGVGRGDPLSFPMLPAPLPPAPQRNQASVPWPRGHRPLRPHVAPPALRTGSAQGLRSAAGADVAMCAWPPNKVRGLSPGRRCRMLLGTLENLARGWMWGRADTQPPWGAAVRVPRGSGKASACSAGGAFAPAPAAPSHPSQTNPASAQR